MISCLRSEYSCRRDGMTGHPTAAVLTMSDFSCVASGSVSHLQLLNVAPQLTLISLTSVGVVALGSSEEDADDLLASRLMEEDESSRCCC